MAKFLHRWANKAKAPRRVETVRSTVVSSGL
jgi:hypothetical protein